MSTLPETINFADLSPTAIAQRLQQLQLNLTVDEALRIQQEFLKRPPTLAECILWSIQGSEHCSYKSSRPYLKQFVTTGRQVILGAKEDAGVIAVATDNTGARYAVVISHESHNHPSQVVPYEGAATGVGGNVRDVCCMGAEVIAVADSLRFGDLARSKTHYIQKGVVDGIAGYGNPLGIPNIAGDVYFDAAYNDNCLVTVVTLGIVREADIIHSYAPVGAQNSVFILVGKPTDNSGFGGASFASANLSQDAEKNNKGAVQEPNAFLQRHILKANYSLFKKLKEKNLLSQVGFKDLGAGGVACASVELADTSGYGAEIEVAAIPTTMPDIAAAVLLCSETQERFMWVVPESLAPFILAHYNETFALPQVSEGARAAIIGRLRTDGQYIAKHHGKTIVDARAHDITKGLLYDRPATPAGKTFAEPQLSPRTEYNAVLLDLLAHENIASRAPIFEHYDKQVQGRTHFERGDADAGVMQPFNSDDYPAEIRQVGIALALAQNPRYNKIDAYWGAAHAVIESARNVIATGATPVAITDCLCFGNPENPACMHDFIAATRGIQDAAKAIAMHADDAAEGLPVIAGNVSFYNETEAGAIPPSPMISCLGVLPDVQYAVTFSLQRPETILVLIGERQDECGGSVYYQLANELGGNIPKPNLATLRNEFLAVSKAIQQGLVLSAHDIADGGIAVALAEMTFKNNIGFKVFITGVLAEDKKLFSETGGFILEIARDKMNALRQLMFDQQTSLAVLGETQSEPVMQINQSINLAILDAKNAWENGLRKRLM